MQDDPLADAMPDFGEELRTLLGERGMSLRELARKAHCDPGYLSKIANGHRPVTPRLAAALDDALTAEGRLNATASAKAFRSRRGSEKQIGSSRGTVTSADVEAVATITMTFRSLDNQFGGGHTHVLAAEYLDSNVIPMLRTGIYTEAVGQRLFGEAAQLAHLVRFSSALAVFGGTRVAVGLRCWEADPFHMVRNKRQRGAGSRAAQAAGPLARR